MIFALQATISSFTLSFGAGTAGSPVTGLISFISLFSLKALGTLTGSSFGMIETTGDFLSEAGVFGITGIFGSCFGALGVIVGIIPVVFGCVAGAVVVGVVAGVVCGTVVGCVAVAVGVLLICTCTLTGATVAG